MQAENITHLENTIPIFFNAVTKDAKATVTSGISAPWISFQGRAQSPAHSKVVAVNQSFPFLQPRREG